MAKIRIGETVYEAKLTHAGGTLGLSFEKTTIEEIASLLCEDHAPQIREMAADGTTKAIYRNHALTRVYAETIGGVYRVSAVMQTEIIEQKEAQALKDQLAAAEAALEKAQERIAQAEARIAQADKQISQVDERIVQADKKIAQADEQIARAQERIAQADERIGQADARIAQAQEQIQGLKTESEMLTGCVLEMSETVYA